MNLRFFKRIKRPQLDSRKLKPEERIKNFFVSRARFSFFGTLGIVSHEDALKVFS